MKIAMITSTFPPYRGGMGNVAEHEARILAESGNTVTVFTPNYGTMTREEQTPYVVRRIVPWLAIGNAAVMPTLVRELSGFDAVHLHYPFFGTAEWVALKTLWDRKFSFTLTYHMDVVGRGWKAMLFRWYSRWVFPFIARRAKRIIVSSRDYAETSSILKRVWKVVEPKLVEIPFPVLAERIRVQPQSTEKYFVCIGGLDKAHYFKGVQNVLMAFAAAKTLLPDFTLKIIGDGDMRQEYQKLAERLGIANAVHFLGSMPPGQRYAETLGAARALICASVDRSEAYGLVLLDALAHNVPLIASNLPGVRTIATPDVALRVPPGDITALATAMGMLANNHELHAKLTSAIPQKMLKYRREPYVQALLQVL